MFEWNWTFESADDMNLFAFRSSDPVSKFHCVWDSCAQQNHIAMFRQHDKNFFPDYSSLESNNIILERFMGSSTTSGGKSNKK